MAEVVIGMLAWQLTLEMRRKSLSKAALAKRMQTSPTQLDRVLMAKGSVTLETLQRARRSSAASCGLSWSEAQNLTGHRPRLAGRSNHLPEVNSSTI